MEFDLDAALSHIKELLNEPSTWRGAVNLLTACGVAIKPEFAELIVSIGLGAVGFIGVAFKDKKEKIETK